MSQNKLNALIALACVVPTDEFTIKANASMPAKLKEALARKRKEQEEKAAEEAAEAILEAVQAAEETKVLLVDNIRRARKQIDEWKKKLAMIDREIQYGYETQNYLPLVHHIHAVAGKKVRQSFNLDYLPAGVDKSAFAVPANWTPHSKSVEQKSEEAGSA